MCCGRSVQNAASRRYVSPPINKGDNVANNQTKPIAKEPTGVPDYPLYEPLGAYYGNPVVANRKKKSKVAERKNAAERASKEADALTNDSEKDSQEDSQEEDEQEELDLLPRLHEKKNT